MKHIMFQAWCMTKTQVHYLAKLYFCEYVWHNDHCCFNDSFYPYFWWRFMFSWGKNLGEYHVYICFKVKKKRHYKCMYVGMLTSFLQKIYSEHFIMWIRVMGCMLACRREKSYFRCLFTPCFHWPDPGSRSICLERNKRTGLCLVASVYKRLFKGLCKAEAICNV